MLLRLKLVQAIQLLPQRRLPDGLKTVVAEGGSTEAKPNCGVWLDIAIRPYRSYILEKCKLCC